MHLKQFKIQYNFWNCITTNAVFVFFLFSSINVKLCKRIILVETDKHVIS